MRRVYIYHSALCTTVAVVFEGSPSLLLTIDPSVKPSKKAHISRSSVNQKVGLLHKQLVQKMHRETKKVNKGRRLHLGFCIQDISLRVITELRQNSIALSPSTCKDYCSNSFLLFLIRESSNATSTVDCHRLWKQDWRLFSGPKIAHKTLFPQIETTSELIY